MPFACGRRRPDAGSAGARRAEFRKRRSAGPPRLRAVADSCWPATRSCQARLMREAAGPEARAACLHRLLNERERRARRRCARPDACSRADLAHLPRAAGRRRSSWRSVWRCRSAPTGTSSAGPSNAIAALALAARVGPCGGVRPSRYEQRVGLSDGQRPPRHLRARARRCLDGTVRARSACCTAPRGPWRWRRSGWRRWRSKGGAVHRRAGRVYLRGARSAVMTLSTLMVAGRAADGDPGLAIFLAFLISHRRHGVVADVVRGPRDDASAARLHGVRLPRPGARGWSSPGRRAVRARRDARRAR